MSKIQINNGEREILEVLWREGKPMITSDIAEVIGIFSNGVNANLKKLMKKGLVEQAGVGKKNNQLAQLYKPTLSREQFLANEVKQNKDIRFTEFFAGLLGDGEDIDESTLADLQKLLDEAKKSLKDKENLE